MATLEFYKQVDNDFSQREGQENLFALTTIGFRGNCDFKLSNFSNNKLELNAAYDAICFFRPVQKINRNYSSYGLKHIVEDYLNVKTKGEINYISNGVLILAMAKVGFKINRDNSPNCFFNVSNKDIKWLRKQIGY